MLRLWEAEGFVGIGMEYLMRTAESWQLESQGFLEHGSRPTLVPGVWRNEYDAARGTEGSVH